MKFTWIVICSLLLLNSMNGISQDKRLRDYGVKPGILTPGTYNAITDVEGVKVGHTTLIKENHIRTGVTAIIPHEDNIFFEKVPAAVYIGNGFGKLAGSTQIEELGNLETPIILTNTLSVSAGIDGLIAHALNNDPEGHVRSVNAVVGETNDGFLNDIRGQHVTKMDVLSAIEKATHGYVVEGNVGAGTGTICFGYKGGIGTSSRVIPKGAGGYTVGVLVQSNFGGVLTINGVNMVGKLSGLNSPVSKYSSSDGSCMIVVATDAPLSPRNLNRLAKRAMLGLAKTGGIASNGSGDYVIAFSTYRDNRIPHNSTVPVQSLQDLRNDEMSPLFLAVIEATEEAILNSMIAARSMTGQRGSIEALPMEEVMLILKENGLIEQDKK